MRDFGLDNSSSDIALLASGRDTLPANALIDHLKVVNNTSNNLAVGVIDIERSNGTNASSLGTNASTLGSTEGMVLHPSGSQNLLARRIVLTTQAD
ncbi:MAG: hypothetical protein AAGF10_00555, partial [Verrucomicrobiota bacterium]